MKRIGLWAITLALLVQLPTASSQESMETQHDTTQPPATEPSSDDAAAIQQWWIALDEVVRVVQQQHFQPPARQQLWLSAARQLFRVAESNAPADLAQRASQLQNRDDELDFCAMIRGQLPPEFLADDRQTEFLSGALFACRLGGQYAPPQQHRVDSQLRENRYVGIGIQLAMNDQGVQVPKVFPRGPADREGMRDGDLILSVDGQSTQDKSLVEVVQMLRGLQGTAVEVEVRQPDQTELRHLKMVRNEVPFRSVFGRSERDISIDSYLLPDESKLAYVRISALHGSTVRELQDVLAELDHADCRGLILDLTHTQTGDIRHGAMLADLLIADGVLGHLERRGHRQTFRARPNNLFKGKPIAVLVGSETGGVVEWLAAALQDSGRARLIGQRTAGNAVYIEWLDLDRNRGGVTIWTGVLRRADGRLMSDTAQHAWEALPRLVPGREEVLRGIAPDQEESHGTAALINSATAWLNQAGSS